MVSPQCTEKDAERVTKPCGGVVYELKAHSNGGKTTQKRVPVKTFPYSSPLRTVQRFMNQPGFAELLRDSRPDTDRPSLASHEKMYDIYDGTAWREQEVGLKREYSDGEVRDVEIRPGSRRRIATYKYGLQFAVNLDWYDPCL